MGNKDSKLHPDDITALNAQTHFTSKEIKDWYKGFKKDYPQGYLTKEEFKKIYGNFYPGGDASAYAENTFKVFDHNNDGKIDFREFITGLSISSRGSFEDKMEWIFQLYDSNKNGFISKDEMLVIVRSIHEMSSGSSDESAAQRHVDKMFQKVDADIDQLSFSDFIKLAKSDPTIANVCTGDMAQY